LTDDLASVSIRPTLERRSLRVPEFRQNVATKDWVIIAPERAKRPDSFGRHQRSRPPRSPLSLDPDCPFCPGNEGMSAEECFRIGEGAEWRVRVIKNKFPALEDQGRPVRRSETIYRSMNGVGIHQVLVESPVHNVVTAELSVPHLVDVLAAAKRQYQGAAADSRIEHVVIFKNHGAGAGTSLEHPHWQMIAMPLVPANVRTRIEEAMRYFDDNGVCVFCRMLAEELSAQARLVVETGRYVSFCPFAAMSPYHTWILPRRHLASFGDTSDDEIGDLAVHVKEILTRFLVGLENPDFNLVVRCAPVGHSKVAYFHYYLSICPRISQAAGFELGSGMFVNTSSPEDCANRLRQVRI
jgi:UDPglucose--hexose-1-phosphate uridylyltransferase